MAAPLIVAFLICQTVWVVDDDGGPGVDFTDIQPAIDAAADGEVVRVMAGQYNPFTLSGKGLSILGAGSTNTIVRDATSPFVQESVIQGVPSNSLARVEGISFRFLLLGLFDVIPQRMRITGSSTRVVLSEVVIDAHPMSIATSTGLPGLLSTARSFTCSTVTSGATRGLTSVPQGGRA